MLFYFHRGVRTIRTIRDGEPRTAASIFTGAPNPGCQCSRYLIRLSSHTTGVGLSCRVGGGFSVSDTLVPDRKVSAAKCRFANHGTSSPDLVNSLSPRKHLRQTRTFQHVHHRSVCRSDRHLKLLTRCCSFRNQIWLPSCAPSRNVPLKRLRSRYLLSTTE